MLELGLHHTRTWEGGKSRSLLLPLLVLLLLELELLLAIVVDFLTFMLT